MGILTIGFKMAYNPDIPQASDDPSQSQGQILANFQALNTFLSVNHVDLNDGDEGKHKFLQFPEQSSAPATAANEGALYTKAVSGATELFFREESNGAELQITGAFTAASPGSVTLAGGLIMNWGSVSAGTTGATTTFDTPFTSAVYSLVCTATSSNPNVSASVTTITLTDAKLFANSIALVPVFYIALGT